MNSEFKNQDDVQEYIFLFERIQDVTERVQHAAQGDLFLSHRIQDPPHLGFFSPERIQHAVTWRSDAGVQLQTDPGLKHNRDAGGEAAPENTSRDNTQIEPSVPVHL